MWLMQKKGHVLEKLAVSVTLAGALSNLHDRLVRGYVVDYFSVNWKGLKKIIFNLGRYLYFYRHYFNGHLPAKGGLTCLLTTFHIYCTISRKI